MMKLEGEEVKLEENEAEQTPFLLLCKALRRQGHCPGSGGRAGTHSHPAVWPPQWLHSARDDGGVATWAWPVSPCTWSSTWTLELT